MKMIVISFFECDSKLIEGSYGNFEYVAINGYSANKSSYFAGASTSNFEWQVRAAVKDIQKCVSFSLNMQDKKLESL